MKEIAHILDGVCPYTTHTYGSYSPSWRPFNARQGGQILECVARPQSSAQLCALMRRCHEHLLYVVCQGAGAGAPAPVHGRAILLEMSALNQIFIDRDKQLARVEGGALTRELIAQASSQGLVAALPRFGGVGVVGASLGGGTGLLSRALGLSAHQLVSAELVLADGQQLTVGPDHELMWALRGAGHLGFGCVKAVTLKLHEVPPAIWGGVIRWPLASAPEVLSRLDAWCQELGSAVGLFVTLANYSPDGPCIEVFGAYLGTLSDGERAFGALAASVSGAANMTQPTDYLTLSGAFSPRPETPLGFVWHHGALKPGADGAALGELGERVVRCMSGRPAAKLRYNLEALGERSLRAKGPLAICRQLTPTPTWACVAASIWAQDVEPAQAALEAMDALEASSQPSLAIWGGHPNYHDPWRPRPLSFYFGFELERLKALKRRYDPEGLLVGMGFAGE